MKNIAVGIDHSDVTPRVLETAKELALATRATLHLVHIFAPEPAVVGYGAYAYPGVDEREEELKQEKLLLRNVVDDLKTAGVEASGFMKEAPIVKGLLEFADERGADLIVVGTHGHNILETVILGSVAEGVVRKSRLPVLVVPAG
ncbi:MAG TPA: universal stress protein [Verrucomicrobiales bacterium]|nr:universal stress protein [Verrucomicrobiales bacterium]